MSTEIGLTRKIIVIGWTLGFALVMGFSMSPYTLHIFKTFFPSPAIEKDMLFGLVPLVTAQTYALQALFILVELIATNLFVRVWRARSLGDFGASISAALMVALLAMGAAFADNQTYARAQVEAKYAAENQSRTQPEIEKRYRADVSDWQKQQDQYASRIVGAQIAIDKIQKDLDTQNAICNYPPTIKARDNACDQVKRLIDEKNAEIAQKRQIESDLRFLQAAKPKEKSSDEAIVAVSKYDSDLQYIVQNIGTPESLFSLALALVIFFFVPLGNGAFVLALEGGSRPEETPERSASLINLAPELERLARMPVDLQLVSAASLQSVLAMLASAHARGHAASEATGQWELKFAHEVDRLRAAADLKRRIARYRGITSAAKKALIESIDKLFVIEGLAQPAAKTAP